jgi:hypothetical protein
MFSLLIISALIVGALLVLTATPAEAHGVRHHHRHAEHVASRRHSHVQRHQVAERRVTHPRQVARQAAVQPRQEDHCFFLGCLARLASAPAAIAEAGTAVYNIAAHAITLPSGTTIEAHSGLGAAVDNPRYAHVRMVGPTPPHEYVLTPRESLFHGVAALRLNPIGGSGTIHGRAGLLVHSCMLGARCESNGCVSIRDYSTFLRAYRAGEFRRLMVVAS